MATDRVEVLFAYVESQVGGWVVVLVVVFSTRGFRVLQYGSGNRSGG